MPSVRRSWQALMQVGWRRSSWTHCGPCFLSVVAPGLSSPTDAAGGEALAQIGPARCVRALEVVGTAIVDMRESLDARTTFEVALVRLTHPEADDGPAALLDRLERLERRVQELASGPPPAAPPPAAPPPAAPPPAAPPPAAPPPAAPRRLAGPQVPRRQRRPQVPRRRLPRPQVPWPQVLPRRPPRRLSRRRLAGPQVPRRAPRRQARRRERWLRTLVPKRGHPCQPDPAADRHWALSARRQALPPGRP